MDHPQPQETPAQDGQQAGGKKLWTVGTLTYTTVGLMVLFAWLLWGDFAWSMKERSIQPVVQKLLKLYSATDLLMGILIASLPAAICLLFIPIVSYKSDRHRGRWGRRIPYILLTTPLTSLTMFGLAAGPWIGKQLHAHLGASSPGENACVLGAMGTCWVVFEFATLAANAVFMALINDVVPQGIIGRFFGWFRMLSLGAGMLFNKLIFPHWEACYAWIFIGMGLLYGVGLTMVCLKVKEGEYPPPPPPVEEVHGKRRGFLAATKTYFDECFTHPYYLWFFAGYTFAVLALNPVNWYSVPYAGSIKMSDQGYGNALFWCYLTSMVLAYPLGALADRIHALRLTMITVGLYTVTAIWAGFFAQTVATFTVAFVAHTVISGMFWTASASLAQRLLPRSRFAELAAAAGMVLSVCNFGLPFLLGSFLDWTHHNYRYTFFFGGVIALAALVSLLVLHSKFMAQGGPKNYVPPDFGREFKK